ncbi:hypothetical protein [Bacillus sp. 3255]|uniref:hypothetical protein n=1 Tax=Bacillus sp. 3255 TaxID=2817904 RepID=UPI0028652149|nr:hypothetical protein [Bacillus sp. 3255]MDR6884319.1 hypothetical protein [Bacillus sp. 3255]
MTDYIKKQHELTKKINWLKEKLRISSNEELFLKALALLFKVADLEQWGYNLYAIKETELSEGVLEAPKYDQIDFRELNIHGQL